MVDGAEIFHHVGTAEHGQRLTHQDKHLVLLRRSFEPARHVHMRRQVRRINFELGADGARNSPAVVQAKSHPHPIVWQSGQESRVFTVVLENSRFVDRSNHLHKGNDAHLGHLRSHLLSEVLAHAPNYQESVAYITIGSTMPRLYNCVHNLCNLIHKDHDLVLQYLCCVCEVPNVAKTKDSFHLVAGNHRIHSGTVVVHVLANDL
mmetsp:Transcript_100751/g.183751  ORF Transcript_100751/g.183751 Transcript_100751/m.183751 type:complete len:205 (-) Transcript_100751:1084-1698(-)